MALLTYLGMKSCGLASAQLTISTTRIAWHYWRERGLIWRREVVLPFPILQHMQISFECMFSFYLFLFLFLLSLFCPLSLVSDFVLGVGHSIRKLYTTPVGCTTMEGTQSAPHFLTLPWPAHVLHFLSLIGSCLVSGSCFISVLLCFTFVSVSIFVALDLVFSVHRHTFSLFSIMRH